MPLHLSDYPQLCLLAWNRDPDGWIDEAEAFALYEANWRHVDPGHQGELQGILPDWRPPRRPVTSQLTQMTSVPTMQSLTAH
ncbi:MAG: hypothetical protein Q4B17_06715 [Lautropia sp.]|nr:hypothetical protein [Lautropia sp.]